MRTRWISLLPLLAACSSEEPAPAAPPTGLSKEGITLRPDVRVLSAAELATIRDEWRPGSTRLTLAASTGVAQGAVLVSGVSPRTPLGMMQRVTAARTEGEMLTLELKNASLAEVLESGRIEVTRGLKKAELSALTPGRPGVKAQAVEPAVGAGLTPQEHTEFSAGEQFVLGLDEVILEDADGDEKTRDDQIRATGSLGIEPALEFVLDASLTGIDEASVSLRTKATLTYSLQAALLAPFDPYRVTLATFTFVPIEIQAGPLPLVFLPQIDLVAQLTGGVGAKLAIGGTAVVEGRAGVGYKDGEFGPITEGSASHENASGAAAGEATVKIEAGPDFSVKLYGIAGPEATLHGYIRARGALGETPCYSLVAGIEATAGFDASALSIFGFGLGTYSTPVFDKQFPIATGDCDPEAAGLNPTAATYAFTLEGDVSLETRAALPLLDGSVVVAVQGTNHAYLVQVLPDGSLGFQRQIADGTFSIAALALSPDQRILVGGAQAGSPWLAKVDREGNLLWSQLYEPSLYNVRGVASTPAGEIALVGSTTDEQSIFREVVLRFHGEEPAFGMTYDGGQETTEVQALADGFLVSGVGVKAPGNSGHLMRLDLEGKVGWNRRFAGAALSHLRSTSVLPDGQVVATGDGPDGVAFLRLSPSGEVVASRLLYNPADAFLGFQGSSVRASTGGDAIVVGTHGFGDSADGLLMSVGTDNLTRFATGFGGAKEDTFRAVVPLADGLLALGHTKSFGAQRQALVVRTTPLGDATPKELARHALTLAFDEPGSSVPPDKTVGDLVVDAPAVVAKKFSFQRKAGGDTVTYGPSSLKRVVR